ncbi:MAG: tol-pal system-associated acyl-CoA thioesterase [Gammaproteobacteria bacterium]
MREFNWNVRVYYEDTDAAGVVYHGNYLKFMERARTEWLRAIGLSQDVLHKEQGIIFAVTKMNIRFQLPAHIDELLAVNTKLVKTGGASLLFLQSITNQQERLLCDADVNAACLNASTLKPQRLPGSLISALANVN